MTEGKEQKIPPLIHFNTTAGQNSHMGLLTDMLIDPLLTIHTGQYIHELGKEYL